MSLVDYAPSSDEEEIGGDEDEDNKRDESGAPPSPLPPPPPNPQSQNLITSSHPRSDGGSPLAPPFIERLPDASLLLASPSLPSRQVIGSDHASRVASAMAESTSRKRESNGSAFPYPHSQHRRGRLPNSRNIPLIPPQLSGRSNVVTEDIGRLFVARHPESSPEPSQASL